VNETTLISIKKWAEGPPDRSESFIKACQMCEKLATGMSIVETGTLRGISGDGGSTRVLHALSLETKRYFVSVDISPTHVSFSRKEVPGANVICEDSVLFLSRYCQQIGLLYLDSYDFYEDDPEPCQRHQLAEVGAAIGKMPFGTLILIDDCKLPHGGKSFLSEKFLAERGWKKIHDGYQTLWANHDNTG
jgi:hypothetical protein